MQVSNGGASRRQVTRCIVKDLRDTFNGHNVCLKIETCLLQYFTHCKIVRIATHGPGYRQFNSYKMPATFSKANLQLILIVIEICLAIESPENGLVSMLL